MKKQIEIIEAYKAVHCVPIGSGDFIMLSLQSAVLPPSFRLQYKLGEVTIPDTGKIFVWRNEPITTEANNATIRKMNPGESVAILKGYAYDIVDVSRYPVFISLPQYTTPAGLRRTWSQGMPRSHRALLNRFKGMRFHATYFDATDEARLCSAFMPTEFIRMLR